MMRPKMPGRLIWPHPLSRRAGILTFIGVLLLLLFITRSSSSSSSRPTPLSAPKISSTSPRQAADCHSGVKIITARGTTEFPGIGYQGDIIHSILSKVPDSSAVPVEYPADFDFNISIALGVARVQEEILDYAESCPRNPMVLMGYSQGAQVIGNALAGGGTSDPFGQISAPAEPIPRTVGENVIAVVMIGDPNRVHGQADNVSGGCNVGSRSPRSGRNFDSMSFYADRIVDYCSATDVVCCSNSKEILGHLSYFTPEAADAISSYVVKKFQAF